VRAPADLAVVDKTGAGDAFAGALAVALLEGRTPADAAVLAVAAASCAVLGYGSQESYPERAELEAMAMLVRRAAVR
jgi:ribokinase